MFIYKNHHQDHHKAKLAGELLLEWYITGPLQCVSRKEMDWRIPVSEPRVRRQERGGGAGRNEERDRKEGASRKKENLILSHSYSV